MVQVLVVIASGFEEIEMLTPVDILKRAGATVTIASIMPKEDGLLVESKHNIIMKCDAVIILI